MQANYEDCPPAGTLVSVTDRFTHHMSDSDSLLWRIEKDPTLRSTIVNVLVLERTPEWPLVHRSFERATKAIPRLRQRVVTPILHLGPPHWSYDQNFDLDYHLRRTRATGGRTVKDALDQVRAWALASFDRARPPWEFVLVEDLVDGRAVAALKIHHSITDGVGGMELAMHIFDLTPELTPSPPGEPEPLPVLGQVSLINKTMQHHARRFGGLVRRSFESALRGTEEFVRDPIGSAGRALETAGSAARTVAPAFTPCSPLMRGRSLARDLRTLDVPVDDMKRAAKVAEGSLNDVFVAALAGGLRRYHDFHGVAVGELRMTMPINVRDGAAAAGNHFTPARIIVPLTVRDPRVRIERIRTLVRATRAEPAIGMTEVLAGVLNRLPSALATALFGAMLKGSDFVASNVPGSPLPLWFAGARVQRNYAFGPTSGAAANITLLSNFDMCCIGVLTDRQAIPDPDRFLECLRAGFDEVLAV